MADTTIWIDRARTRCGDLSLIRQGAGASVLLLHGVGLRAEAWAPLIDHLADAFQVTAADMPGHGDSPRLDDPTNLQNYSNSIARLLDDRTVVIGHSMGVMIAMDLAARYPHHVAGVVALNAIFERDTQAMEAVRARAAELDGVTRADTSVTLSRWFGTQETPARRACEDWLRKVDPAGYRDAYHVFAHQDGPSRQVLLGLKCPALFITGADEPNSTPAMSRAMAELAPAGRALILEDAAHMMPMTHADQLAPIIHAFAKECHA